jgi:hypothetical protein
VPPLPGAAEIGNQLRELHQVGDSEDGWDLMDLARSWADIRSWPAIDMWSEFF